MQITHLSLANFRVYAEAQLRFSAPTTVVVGDNAQGKTSLLEAICVLVRTKSHRTNRDDELIRWGSDQATCEGEFERSARGPVSLRAVLTTPEAAQFLGCPAKQLAVNNQLVSGPREIIGQLSAVLFSPDDLALAKGDPAGRRRFLNVAIGQIHPLHLADMQQYRRALQQRGQVLALIAEGRATPAQLNAWDQQVAKYGAEIVLTRGQYLADLAQAAERIHRELTDGAEELRLRYRSSVWQEGGAQSAAERPPPTVDSPHLGPSASLRTDMGQSPAALQGAILERLESRRTQEIALRRTLTGPHRDDLALEVGGKELRKYGSQGQQRTAVLALRLGEAEVARARLDETPLVLLDDCLSELDEKRARRVLEQAGAETQLVITTTHLSEALSRIGEAEVYRVEGGAVGRQVTGDG